MKRAFVMAGVLLTAVVVVAGAGALVERLEEASPEGQARARAEALRDRIREVRPRMRACVDGLERAEEEFRSQERRTNDLRARVESLEELDAEGVPAERYEEYLEVFEGYNESLPEWERRADAVQELSARCRALGEEHNRLADSLRRIVAESGIWEGDRMPPSGDGDADSGGG